MNPRVDLAADTTEPGLSDPRGAAREQFVHGLLEALHRDRPEDTDRRLASVMARIETPILRSAPWRPWRLVSGMAAAMILVAVAMLSLPSQQSALAMVQASIEASRTAGDRRYEIRVAIADEAQPVARSLAVLDVRDPDHYLLRVTADNGEKITMGRNPEGNWAIKREGTIDRIPPKWLLSEWMSFGGTTMVLMTVDDVLARLEDAYALTRGTSEALGNGTRCDRVTARLRARPSADPGRVELWLDPHTRVVRRIEMVWEGDEGGAALLEREPRRGGKDGGRRGDRPPPPGDGRPPRGEARPRPPSLGKYAATPRTAVFELGEPATFPEGWFDPGTHTPR